MDKEEEKEDNYIQYSYIVQLRYCFLIYKTSNCILPLHHSYSPTDGDNIDFCHSLTFKQCSYNYPGDKSLFVVSVVL